MKLLITGGCGFLGSNLAAHALNKGFELCIFDNLSRRGSQSNLGWLEAKGMFRFIHGDIRNANDISKTVKNFRPDIIFHLAGQVAMTTSIENPRLDFEINVAGTFNLIEAVKEYAPSSGIIYSSTNKVYGDLEQFAYSESAKRFNCIEFPEGFDESTPLNFQSPYGCSKGAADQYLLDSHRIFGLKTIVFRHSSMYGGRQFATADQGWIGWFCQKAIEKKLDAASSFSISGNGKQVRDVLHAEDMISLYFSAAEKLNMAQGNAYNIGGGFENSLSLLELFDILSDAIEMPLDYERKVVRSSDQRVFIADIAKAKNDFEWTPKVSAKSGVLQMLNWVESNISPKNL